MKKKLILILLFIVSLVFIEMKFDIVSLNKKIAKSKNITQIKTSYYNLKLEYFKIPLFSKYGAIESFENKIIYISGESDFFILEKNKNNNKYILNKIDIKKINNKKNEFIKKNQEELGQIASDLFGVKDILITNFNGYQNKIIIVSSLNYSVEKDCYDISLFLSEIVNNDPFKINRWSKIFSSNECLSIDLTQKPKFAAASAGGRLSKLDEDNIIFTIGDFYSDGKNGPMLSQDLNNHYGKILKINIKDKSHNIFSYGHRNPQGLYIDKNKNIFSTEHGPRHGDEINLIFENKNYGWPLASFGTDYGSRKWPLDETNSTHSSYEIPILSFGNQIGISNLIIYEDNYFDKWNNNLLVSTLATQQIIRLVFDKQKKSLIYIENIPINKRIRDIIKLDNGKVALLTDRGNSEDELPEIIILDLKDNN